jgi:hypothetical protein
MPPVLFLDLLDAGLAAPAARQDQSLECGDHVTLEGRRYVVRAVDPAEIDRRRVYLEDEETLATCSAAIGAVTRVAA